MFVGLCVYPTQEKTRRAVAIMNHLLVFEIENIQADYSAVMEGISLLEGRHIEEFDNLRKNSVLKDGFYRTALDSMTGSPRYLECPSLKPVAQPSAEAAVMSMEEVWLRYYKTLHNPAELLVSDYDKLSRLHVQKENTTEQVVVPNIIRGRLTKVPSITPALFREDLRQGNAFYAIRVWVDRSFPCELQYLALLLSRFPYLAREKRIFILLLDKACSCSHFPFCDPRDAEGKKELNAAHSTFSQYLRLLAKENTGVIYAPFYEHASDGTPSQPIVAPLDYTSAAAGDVFFPLVMINQEEYNKLFNAGPVKSPGWLSAKIQRDSLLRSGALTEYTNRALFHLGKNRFWGAAGDDPSRALLPYIAETAWTRLRRNWQTETGELDIAAFTPMADVIASLFAGEPNHWLCFSLFSFLLQGEDGHAPTPINVHDTYRLARELSNGLQQLVQNAIQHTESASCIFTFYLDTANKRLHLYISDLNLRDTMVENFKERLNAEVSACQSYQHAIEREQIVTQPLNLTGLTAQYGNLLDEDALALRHFFNVFTAQELEDGSLPKKWCAFRQSDSTAHIGLLIFFQTLLRAHADFTLQSTKTYLADGCQGNLFIGKVQDWEQDKGKSAVDGCPRILDRTNEYSSAQNQRVIPGTQYLIQVPVTAYRMTAPVGGASLSDAGHFTEDYRTFAKYVDYTSQPIMPDVHPILAEAETYSTTNAHDKFKLQLLWTVFGHRLLISAQKAPAGTVLVWRVDKDICTYLSNEDHVEVFLKGILAALNQVSPKHPLYLALTGLSPVFFTGLKNVCISLSNCSFAPLVQLFFADTDCEHFVQLFGSSLYEALSNAVTLTIEHGSNLFGVSDMVSARHIASLTSPAFSESYVPVLPFDAIIPLNPSINETLFDHHICRLAQRSLDKRGSSGYKLESTHVRLGNKVHIESFYEMSFLFYRTTIANRTAFQILRFYAKELQRQLDLASLQLSPILFYSYASYSKAILTSVVEISRAYVENLVRTQAMLCKPPMTKEAIENTVQMARQQIGFASYQHNLQSESTSDSVQLYFGIPVQYQGGTLNSDGSRQLMLRTDVAVVQIVPISSTMSTFDKMFAKLKSCVCPGPQATLRLRANYTTMWVYDDSDYANRLNRNVLHPSVIEAPYWDYADTRKRCIHVRADSLRQLADCPEIIYSTQGSASWHNPFFCKLCFPDADKLIAEIPLVETDLTSTVPAMQLHQELEIPHSPQADTIRRAYIEDNNQRLSWLEGCVYYGHIRRGKNHHQYYINTQDFFYKHEVQQEIESWLTQLRKKQRFSHAKLKIIFSPEHNTNVGFAQYVNTFYFGGTAEIISVNEDKIYRSNFVCEHEMLRSTIARAHLEDGIFTDQQPVEFYFVDDTINTGVTIHKANSLLHSLLPPEYAQLYPAFLFSQCFVLIDRMSDASKRTYVNSGSLADFHSFLHVDISNMRVHGDSCVGCKLQRNAKMLFKRSASRLAANYWANKYLRLHPTDYDDSKKMKRLLQEPHSYARLVLSHIAQNYIFKDAVITRKKGEYYDSILCLFFQLLSPGDASFPYKSLIDDLLERTAQGPNTPSRKEAQRLLAELLLKLLSRPFFSFDHAFRLQLQSFLLILSECYLFCCVEHPDPTKNDWADFIENRLILAISKDDPHKGFLRDNDRLKQAVLVAQSFLAVHEDDDIKLANFFKDVLFEALADIRSTYLLRRSVLERVNRFTKMRLHSKPCNCRNLACPYLLDPSQCSRQDMETCFWIVYLAHVQREIDCTNDEIKTIWLEYLVLSGEELPSDTDILPSTGFFNEGQTALGFQTLLPDIPSVVEELFLLTSGVEYDYLQKAVNLSQEDFTRSEIVGTLEERAPDPKDQSNLLRNQQTENCWRCWLGRRDNDSARRSASQWYHLLALPSSSSEHISQTEKWYEKLLTTLCDFIVNYSAPSIDKRNLTVALLTMSKGTSQDRNTGILRPTSSIENIQVVHAEFGAESTPGYDRRRGKYIVKDRVARAFNEDVIDSLRTVGSLRVNGYHIVFSDPLSEEEYTQAQHTISFNEHHIIGNHRKPYLILLFDNPELMDGAVPDGLGRKLTALSYVFLYISIDIPNKAQRDLVPRIIMRDILTYRNRIMRLLEEDFNGDLMEKNAEFLQERIILTHERSASHASTIDDAGILRGFGLGSISKMKVLDYPVDLRENSHKRILSADSFVPQNPEGLAFSGYDRSTDLWLLLQSYVNVQIARLFSRHFNEKDKELVKEEGIPALYLSPEDEQIGDVFKHRTVVFQDLNITPDTPDQDNRFVLLGKAANLHYDVPPDSPMACFGNEWYNAEYIRCILMDVILSALKHATADDSLLPRVDRLMQEKIRPRSRTRRGIPIASHIFIFRSGSYLIILNNVKSNVISCPTEDINEEIFRRTHDVLDYGDGHMSLFTIRHFLLGLWRKKATLEKDATFQYLSGSDLWERYHNTPLIAAHQKSFSQYKIWFETQLPIFGGEQ